MDEWGYYTLAFWYNNRERIKKVAIEKGVTTIESFAFDSYISLTSITIPSSVTTIGTQVFFGWKSNQTIYIKGRNSAPSNWNDSWASECQAKIVWNG